MNGHVRLLGAVLSTGKKTVETQSSKVECIGQAILAVVWLVAFFAASISFRRDLLYMRAARGDRLNRSENLRCESVARLAPEHYDDSRSTERPQYREKTPGFQKLFHALLALLAIFRILYCALQSIIFSDADIRVNLYLLYVSVVVPGWLFFAAFSGIVFFWAEIVADEVWDCLAGFHRRPTLSMTVVNSVVLLAYVTSLALMLAFAGDTEVERILFRVLFTLRSVLMIIASLLLVVYGSLIGRKLRRMTLTSQTRTLLHKIAATTVVTASCFVLQATVVLLESIPSVCKDEVCSNFPKWTDIVLQVVLEIVPFFALLFFLRNRRELAAGGSNFSNVAGMKSHLISEGEDADDSTSSASTSDGSRTKSEP